MINITEVLDSRADNTRMVSQADFDDLKLIFYVVCVVFAGSILILIGCVIGLFTWIHKISLSLKKEQENTSVTFKPRPIGKTLSPNEELSKRYTMSGEHNDSFKRSPTLDRNPLSKPTSLRRFDPPVPKPINKNQNLNSPPGLKKQSQKRERQASASLEGMHFAEDRLRNDLYY
ncbi:hypothetical protein ILUMI_13172 [Ignelater luminosus]|uniref:Uncharacterized protein n=1 Tax=Ignelater luminosus TaxID=2038154 RepID=A0A8K0GBN6_IGNLU|nr:hypothetical protein ILUMI_13172 [Ignelater luminosus]